MLPATFISAVFKIERHSVLDFGTQLEDRTEMAGIAAFAADLL